MPNMLKTAAAEDLLRTLYVMAFVVEARDPYRAADRGYRSQPAVGPQIRGFRLAHPVRPLAETFPLIRRKPSKA